MIEKNRTTHNKTISDFKSCTKANNNSTFCFIDDQYHPYMEKDNVYYIHVKPYVNILSTDIIKDNLNKLHFSENLINHVITNINKYHFQVEEINKKEEKKTTKQILMHIQKYLHESTKTKKKRIVFNKTRKLI